MNRFATKVGLLISRIKPHPGVIVLIALQLNLAPAIAAPALPMYDGLVHQGVASCANSVCHGSVIPHIDSNIAHTEYTVWTRKDPHSQTFNDLFRADYIAITRKLGLKPPHREPTCLACHASNIPEPYRGAKFSMNDGIGCETCHGGAEKYLSTHTAEGATRAQNIEQGLYPTDNLRHRARLCLGCHYGTRDQFVTHEIMGAGHPRISFEFDLFTELLNPHVIFDDDYRARKPVYSHVKMWAVGQAMAAESMLEMLDGKHLQSAGLFPELSLFDCHSCHHPMSQQTWQPRSGTGLGPGAVPLNDSSLLMLRLILQQVAPQSGKDLAQQIRALHQASNTGLKATQQASARLRTLVDKAIATIDAHEFAAADVVALTRSLLAAGIDGEYADYIAAEQAVMAIGALIAAWDAIEPFDGQTSQIVSESMNILYESVANDESFKPRTFASALQRLRGGLLE